MSDMLKKLEYLNETKSSITNSLTKKGVVIPDNTPFREYYKLIDDIGKNDFADKEFLIEVLLGKKPELEGVITINSSLRDIANQFMTIGSINLRFKEYIETFEITKEEISDIKPTDFELKINTNIHIPLTNSIEKVKVSLVDYKPNNKVNIEFNNFDLGLILE